MSGGRVGQSAREYGRASREASAPSNGEATGLADHLVRLKYAASLMDSPDDFREFSVPRCGRCGDAIGKDDASCPTCGEPYAEGI